MTHRFKDAMTLILTLVMLLVAQRSARAASADITLDNNDVATIEADTTQRTATVKGEGSISNGGSVKVFVSLGGGSVATTDAQAKGIIGLAPGTSIPLPRGTDTFTYKTASGASVLYWTPQR